MTDSIEDFRNCDLCGSKDAIEIPFCREYTNGQPIHICSKCGFVHVKNRRSAQEIAEAWSTEIFGEKQGTPVKYTARIPAVKARQVYVADTIDSVLGLKGKKLCDIGGGEGQFLEIARADPYEADVFAIEPSAENCQILDRTGIPNFCGTIEDFSEQATESSGTFDIVSIMWTLENCHSCVDMMNAAYDVLKPGGKIVAATGSRILVPFKKPLNLYLGPNPADTHSFRFSAKTMKGLMAETGFSVEYENRYVDTDYLIVIGEKVDRSEPITWQGDDPGQVAAFFERWHWETKNFYHSEIGLWD